MKGRRVPFWRAKLDAERRGLWLLAEGAGHAEKWIIYQRRLGLSLATFFPASGRLYLAGREGASEAMPWSAALEKVAAAGLDVQQRARVSP